MSSLSSTYRQPLHPTRPGPDHGTVVGAERTEGTPALRTRRCRFSKSASASQVISFPWSGFATTFRSKGADGGEESLTVPFFTYSIQAWATAAFGSQTASR